MTVPESSGPRWARDCVARSRSSGETRALRVAIPKIPHIVFQGVRQRIWYCAPNGSAETYGSKPRKKFRNRGNRKRKSTAKILNPLSTRNFRASRARIGTASRSSSQRDITYRVPGLRGLFSQKAKTPPGRKDL